VTILRTGGKPPSATAPNLTRMAKAKRIILFLSTNAATANAAAAAFNTAAGRLGLPWAGAHAGDLAAAEVLVPLDAPAPAGWSGRVEKWAGGDPS
jgi:translation initiation factor 1